MPYNTLPPFEQRDSWSSYGAVRDYSPKFFYIRWGTRERDFSDSSMGGKSLKNAFSWWTWDSNSRPTTHSLSTTPFGIALVRWATGKRSTNRLPTLSLIRQLYQAEDYRREDSTRKLSYGGTQPFVVSHGWSIIDHISGSTRLLVRTTQSGQGKSNNAYQGTSQARRGVIQALPETPCFIKIRQGEESNNAYIPNAPVSNKHCPA